MASKSRKQEREDLEKKVDELLKYDWKEEVTPHAKIAVIGDDSCHKTYLILAALGQILPAPSEEFLFKQYPLNIELEDGQVETCMVLDVDTRKDRSEKRLKSYSEVDVFLLCFAIDDPASLKNAEEKWYPEIKKFSKPTFLVGLHPNHEVEPKLEKTTQMQVEKLGKKLKNLTYGECSAYKSNAIMVFVEALKFAKLHEFCPKTGMS